MYHVAILLFQRLWMVINMKKTNRNKYRLWSIDLDVPFRTNWIHKSGYFYTKNFSKLRITKKTISQIQKDSKVCNCLINMHIEMEQFTFPKGINIPMAKKAHIICDDIKFDCCKKPGHSVWDCIDNMVKGKCPYKIARRLYPDKYQGR